jgi:hypothetical protein
MTPGVGGGQQMFLVVIGFVAIILCFVIIFTLVAAFVTLFVMKPKAERLLGIIAAASAVISYAIYYYARIVISGGSFSDGRVVMITAVYIVAAALSVAFAIDGKRKLGTADKG